MDVKSKKDLWKEAKKQRRLDNENIVFPCVIAYLIMLLILLVVAIFSRFIEPDIIVLWGMVIILIATVLGFCLVRPVVSLTKKKTKKMVFKICNKEIAKLRKQLEELPEEMLEEYRNLSSALIVNKFTIAKTKKLKLLPSLVSRLEEDQKTLSQDLDSLDEKFEKKKQEIEDSIKYYQQIIQ
jgi:uncharacterized membrane-anchored protein YhcB (DUF1043 family)